MEEMGGAGLYMHTLGLFLQNECDIARHLITSQF